MISQKVGLVSGGLLHLRCDAGQEYLPALNMATMAIDWLIE